MSKYTSWKQIMECALAKCSDDNEKQRVLAEDKLFKKYKWKQYVLFVANLITEINESQNDIMFEFSGSVADSFILHTICPFFNEKERILKPRACAILFNDAFRFIISFNERYDLFRKAFNRLTDTVIILLKAGFTVSI